METYSVVTSFGEGNEQALQICREIAALNYPSEEEIRFDFSMYNENNPFSNLVIANAVRDYKKTHSNKLSLSPHSSNYLAHLGFYHMIGAEHGKQVGEARASSNYVPIRCIKFEGDFYRSIENQAETLAGLLRFDSRLQSFLEYIFIETIRNVYEHSSVDEVHITAQKWPSMNLLEIAIADTGCGIANSLRTRFGKFDEKQLLYLSCQPGISACSNYSFLEKDDGWRNSGYGLYLLRKLSVAYGGSFLVASGGTALRQGGKGVSEYETHYSGTAVAIRIRTDMDISFDKTRDNILAEGEKKSKEIKGAISKASKSSGGHYHG